MRYPFLHPIESAPGLDQFHRLHLRRAAETICRRTGLHACYNARFGGSILFHHGDQFGGPLKLDAFHPDGSERRWSDVEIDNAVEWIKMGYVSREKKERIAARNKWLEECAQRDAQAKHFDDLKPNAAQSLSWHDRKRRGVQKLISAY